MKYSYEPKGVLPLELLAGKDALKPLLKVIIDLFALQKIKEYVDLCPDEINGLAMVDEVDGDLLITAPFIVKQISSKGGLHVEHDHIEFNRYITEMVQRGENPARLKCQWHSHVWGQAFFSGEDIDTIRGYLCDYMIGLVMNKRGEYKCRLDIFKPLYFGFDVKLFVRISNAQEHIMKACQKDIDEKVSYSFLRKVESKLWPQKEKSHGFSIPASEIVVSAENLLEPEKESNDERNSSQ